MKIITGKQERYQKIVVYGPEGIGKSTFAAHFPKPLFIDTEASTAHMDVARLERPTSWAVLMEYVQELTKDHQGFTTLVIDTIDWAEQLCVQHICSKYQVSGIEDIGYGKGYVYEKEEFGRLLNKLHDLIESGMNVVLTAHAMVRKFERPDQPPYDRYELKLNKAASQKISDMVKEWADMLLFTNYKEEVLKVDSKDSNSKKVRVSGGQRVMYTSHHPNWDAKNRHGLKECLPFEFSQIENCIPQNIQKSQVEEKPVEEMKTPPKEESPKEEPVIKAEPKKKAKEDDGIPKDLKRLMEARNITEAEIQAVVGSKGYFPADMRIKDYPKEFIDGCLTAAFDTVAQAVEANRDENVPF